MRQTHYSVYKKNSAFQLKFAKPKSDDSNPYDVKQGYLFIEFAKVLSDSGSHRIYNWKDGQKISMKLGVRDISQILVEYKKEDGAKIVHDPQAGTSNAKKMYKTLTVKKGKTPGTYFWTIFFPESGEISVPVDIYEQLVLLELMKSSISKIFGW